MDLTEKVCRPSPRFIMSSFYSVKQLLLERGGTLYVFIHVTFNVQYLFNDVFAHSSEK